MLHSSSKAHLQARLERVDGQNRSPVEDARTAASQERANQPGAGLALRRKLDFQVLVDAKVERAADAGLKSKWRGELARARMVLTIYLSLFFSLSLFPLSLVRRNHSH